MSVQALKLGDRVRPRGVHGQEVSYSRQTPTSPTSPTLLNNRTRWRKIRRSWSSAKARYQFSTSTVRIPGGYECRCQNGTEWWIRSKILTVTAKPQTRDHRVYTRLDPEINQALAAAPAAELVPADAPASLRLHAWVLYGYRQWRSQRDEAAKFAAYAEIAAEEGREELLDAYLEQAVDAGIL